jgi:hypothetical protein
MAWAAVVAAGTALLLLLGVYQWVSAASVPAEEPILRVKYDKTLCVR